MGHEQLLDDGPRGDGHAPAEQPRRDGDDDRTAHARDDEHDRREGGVSPGQFGHRRRHEFRRDRAQQDEPDGQRGGQREQASDAERQDRHREVAEQRRRERSGVDRPEPLDGQRQRDAADHHGENRRGRLGDYRHLGDDHADSDGQQHPPEQIVLDQAGVGHGPTVARSVLGVGDP